MILPFTIDFHCQWTRKYHHLTLSCQRENILKKNELETSVVETKWLDGFFSFFLVVDADVPVFGCRRAAARPAPAAQRLLDLTRRHFVDDAALGVVAVARHWPNTNHTHTQMRNIDEHPNQSQVVNLLKDPRTWGLGSAAARSARGSGGAGSRRTSPTTSASSCRSRWLLFRVLGRNNNKKTSFPFSMKQQQQKCECWPRRRLGVLWKQVFLLHFENKVWKSRTEQLDSQLV